MAAASIEPSEFNAGSSAALKRWPWQKRERDPNAARNPKRFKTGLFSQSAPSLLKSSNVSFRNGERPDIAYKGHHVIMLTQQCPDDLLQRFIFEATKALDVLPNVDMEALSTVSMATTSPCFMLNQKAPLPPCMLESNYSREFANIQAKYSPELESTERQGGGAGSQHLMLSPRDAKLLIDRGWAEWHPAASDALPRVVVYAPRDQSEMNFCMDVLRASAMYIRSYGKLQLDGTWFQRFI